MTEQEQLKVATDFLTALRERSSKDDQEARDHSLKLVQAFQAQTNDRATTGQKVS